MLAFASPATAVEAIARLLKEKDNIEPGAVCLAARVAGADYLIDGRLEASLRPGDALAPGRVSVIDARRGPGPRPAPRESGPVSPHLDRSRSK